MLLPCAGTHPPRQLGPRQRLRLLHVRLIERVHPQTDAQLPRGILPRNARRAQSERLGRHIGDDLAIGILRPDGIVDHGNHAAFTPRRTHSSHVAYSHETHAAPRASGSGGTSVTTWPSGYCAPTGSSTTGITPRPPLPVLSARSGSIRSASRVTAAGGRSTSLSRPARAAAAIRAPSARAASGATASARSSRTRPSIPPSAAGRNPTTATAAERPPTSGGCGNTARKRRSRASVSSGLPGSGMATKRSGPARAARNRENEGRSAVVPDLLEI